VIDCVSIGSAIVAYIEPHAGEAVAFNRWYERDHFYAAAVAGPGAFAGGRFVATRACKAARPSETLFGDPNRGSYLALYWLLPGTQEAWAEWTGAQVKSLSADGRMFAGRDHIHTAQYGFEFDVRADGGPFAALALDRAFDGAVMIAVRGHDLDGVRQWCDSSVGPHVPVTAAFTEERLIMSVLDDAVSDPASHVLVVGFVDGDVLEVWRDVVEPALKNVDVGFASPFLRTIPGTDIYTDEL
jgi:hypothetical protein